MVKILSINSGSATLKWRLFEMPAEREIAYGLIDFVEESKTKITVKYGKCRRIKEYTRRLNFRQSITELLEQLKSLDLVNHLHEIKGVGHRVVAGGEVFKKSTVVTKEVLYQINNLNDFAPLHNHVEANCIKVFSQVMPWAKEVSVFDSSFHQTIPAVNYLYGIPYKYYKEYGVRKYGAHGTSVRYVLERISDILGKPLTELRLIVMHLGSGSSVTAIKGGKSIDTSMGFTPLDGLMMSTRSGSVDVSLIMYLAQKLGIKNPEKMIGILNNQSGLLGISGISGDQRKLKKVADKQPQARLALDMYANRVIKFVGAYIAQMKGVDALIFTGGVGENSFEMREQIMSHFGFVGAYIDKDKNRKVGQEIDISNAKATVKTVVIPTNEELMIARDVYRSL